MIAPLVPAEADLRDFAFMPLDVVRLIDSDLAAVSTGDEFKAAVMLWCKAWHQIPASSLPDDDRMLAHLAGYGRDLKAWKKVKDGALRGFVLCGDGRLYHPVIAEKVMEAIEAKKKRRDRTAAATKARQGRSNENRDESHDEHRIGQGDEQRDGQRNENRNVHQGTGTGTGTGILVDEVGRARDPGAALERALREAAGWQSEPAPKLSVTGEIQSLIDNGADLELDVLPIVKALAPQAGSRTSWRYFVGAIARQRDQRIAAATVISLPNSTARTPSHGTRQQKPTRAETFDAIRSRIDRLEAAEAQSGTAEAGDTGPRDTAEGAA